MNDLPVDCIAKILSFTTPRDVCRSSAVSKVFRSAAKRDDVWKRFLTFEFPEGFTAPEGLRRSKDLFFSLVDNPLLHHGSQLSFSLEKTSGKKCYMIAARALDLTWGDDQRMWQWISHPNTRFEVAELVGKVYKLLSLVITGKMNITLLSDDTRYAAYFVFKWRHGPCEFHQPVVGSLVMAGTKHVYLQPPMRSLVRDELRSDGWHEVKFGQFNRLGGDMGELEMRLSFKAKTGLIVHGIEIRPLPLP